MDVKVVHNLERRDSPPAQPTISQFHIDPPENASKLCLHLASEGWDNFTSTAAQNKVLFRGKTQGIYIHKVIKVLWRTALDVCIRVAQRKRGGPITHRSEDRNLALIIQRTRLPKLNTFCLPLAKCHWCLLGVLLLIVPSILHRLNPFQFRP
uniref:Uncharacterized protein n=1 Tax=Physcomitrium patens TaxID=3218 RepID=A0A2K1K1J3_PHYPA|nr:hypothetical protein PHYPA_012126 [Physcomitrium patens]PNR47654.1 hypothetical protein PHYPA_012127 [Physcomitrium patens]